MSLILRHWEPNGPDLKVLTTLYEKGADFESRYTDPSAFEPDLEGEEARLNPEGEGPILVAHGQPMSESFFISLYLDEAFPKTRLRPEGAPGHWRVLAFARFVGEVVAPAVATLGCHAYLAPRLARRDRSEVLRGVEGLPTAERKAGWMAALDDSYGEELLADSRRKASLAISRAEAMLEKGPWLLGETYSLSDIDLFALANSLPKLTPELTAEAPCFTAWLERMRARPAVQEALAMSRSGKPDEAFAPGPEHSRWG